jgi:hypothetical protein
MIQFRKKRWNCPISLSLFLAKDIELKNFTVFTPTEYNLDSDLWSKFCETLEERSVSSTPTAGRLRTSTDDETNNGVATKI